MLNLKTYKAKFQTSNKYLKYFCDNAASERTLKKYQKYFKNKNPEETKKAFIKNLKIIKHNAKGIHSDVSQHINQVMESLCHPCASSSRNTNNITVYYVSILA